MSNGGTCPLAAPKSTSIPRGRSDASDASKVSAPHAVVGDVDPTATREAAHLGREVVDDPVVEHVVGAEAAGGLALLRPPGGRDDRPAARPHHLHEQLPDPAGRGVHERGVPGPTAYVLVVR